MAGPNHAALGELVQNEYAYSKLLESLSHAGLLGKEIELLLPRREVSRYVGQQRRNLLRLEQESGTLVRRVLGKEDLQEPLPQPWHKA